MENNLQTKLDIDEYYYYENYLALFTLLLAASFDI